LCLLESGRGSHFIVTELAEYRPALADVSPFRRLPDALPYQPLDLRDRRQPFVELIPELVEDVLRGTPHTDGPTGDVPRNGARQMEKYLGIKEPVRACGTAGRLP
jgi:hypothetical protein